MDIAAWKGRYEYCCIKGFCFLLSLLLLTMAGVAASYTYTTFVHGQRQQQPRTYMCTMEISKHNADDDIDRLSVLKWLQANRNEGYTVKAINWAAQR